MGQYYGPDFLKPYMMAYWDTEAWLYGEWTKEDQDAFDFLYSFDLFRGKFDQILDRKKNDKYLKRNGLTYADVKDPRKLTVKSSLGMSLNYVSSNVTRLYR